jgi:hypothetical protein
LSTILVIALIALLLILVASAVFVLRRKGRDTRQARVEAEARRAEAGRRLEAANRERAIAKRQLEHADRVDPDRA